MTARSSYEPVPYATEYLMLGDPFDTRVTDTPIQTLMKLARRYGPIFWFYTPLVVPLGPQLQHGALRFARTTPAGVDRAKSKEEG